MINLEICLSARPPVHLLTSYAISDLPCLMYSIPLLMTGCEKCALVPLVSLKELIISIFGPFGLTSPTCPFSL